MDGISNFRFRKLPFIGEWMCGAHTRISPFVHIFWLLLLFLFFFRRWFIFSYIETDLYALLLPRLYCFHDHWICIWRRNKNTDRQKRQKSRKIIHFRWISLKTPSSKVTHWKSILLENSSHLKHFQRNESLSATKIYRRLIQSVFLVDFFFCKRNKKLKFFSFCSSFI